MKSINDAPLSRALCARDLWPSCFEIRDVHIVGVRVPSRISVSRMAPRAMSMAAGARAGNVCVVGARAVGARVVHDGTAPRRMCRA